MKINKKLSFVLVVFMISLCLITTISASDVNDTYVSAVNDFSQADGEISEVSQAETSKQSSSLNITQLGEEDNSDSSKEVIYVESILEQNNDDDAVLENNYSSSGESLLGACDSEDGLTMDWNPTFLYLQNCINRLKYGLVPPVLDLDCDYYATNETGYEGIVLENSIIINGNGHTLDAKYLSRIFTVKDGAVEIYNLTMIHGRDINSKNMGASICWLPGLGVLANCTIKDSYLGDEMTKYGGGVYTDSLSLSIRNCTFENLHANYGNAIYCTGGLVFNYNIKISNCIFKNNFDPYGHYYTCYSGGAIYFDSNPEKYYCIVNNCWFENNMAENGGAIYGYKTAVVISNSVFFNNTASKSGGALYFDGKQEFTGVINNLFKSNKIATAPDKFTKYDNIYSTNDLNVVKNWWSNTCNNIKEDLTYVNDKVYAKSWYYFDTTVQSKNMFYGDEMIVALRHTNFTELKEAEKGYIGINLFTIGGQRFTTKTVNLTMASSFTLRYGENTVSYYVLPVDEAKYTIYLGNIEIFNDSFQPQKTYSLKELQYLVSITNDKLTLDHDYTYNDITDSAFSNIVVDHELTIDGNGYTVDGLSHGLFEITADNVIIENINLVNSTHMAGSAIIWRDANNGILRNSTISNSFSFTAGVVYVKGKNVSLISNTFDNNTVINSKGILYLEGSDFQLINNTFLRFTVGSNAYPIGTPSGNSMTKILNVCNVFENNKVYSSFSQLQSLVRKKASSLTLNYDFYYYDSTDYDLIDGISITGSKSIEGNGFTINGADLARVFIINEGLNVTFNNINFINAQNLIKTNSSILTFNNCTFYEINNTFNFENVICNITNCSFLSNYGEYVINSSSFNNLSITQSTFIKNNVSRVIEIVPEMFNEGFLNITHSVFVNPEAEYEIYSYDTLKNYTIDNNWWGNIINNYENNNRSSLEANNWYFIDMGASSVFAKIDINNLYDVTKNKTSKENANLPEVTFDLSATYLNLNSNTITLETDGTGLTTYTTSRRPATLTLVLGKDLITKIIKGNGEFNLLQEVIYNATAGSTLTLNRSYTFETDKDAVGYILIDKPLILDVNGYTINGNGTTEIFYVTADNVVISNMNMINGYENTQSDNYGSPILWEGDSGSILNSNFTNNKASDGGVITWKGNEGVINLCTFINNTATNKGGAIIWDGENGQIINSIFKNNTAERGGAIYFTEKSLIFRTGLYIWVLNSTFENNKARLYGGAINVYADDVFIYESKFINDTAQYGGAVYLERECGNILLSYFENNTASIDGGAVYVDDDECVISSSTFVKNHADQNGGAVTWNDDRGTVYNSIFENNTALNGGALYVNKNEFLIYFADISVIDSIFENNSATDHGGAIYLANKENTLNNTKFIKNTASNGGALYVAGNDNVIVKSVFLNNTATSQASAIYVEDVSTSIFGNVFMNNSGSMIYFKDDSWFAPDTLNIDYNWFGNNETDYNSIPVFEGDIICNIWYFFNMTMEDGVLTIALNNLYNGSADEISVDDNCKLPDLIFKVDSDNFEVDDEATLENGVAKLNYVAKNTTAFLTASYETSKMTRFSEFKFSNVTTTLVDGDEFVFDNVTIEYEVTNPTEVEIIITDSDGKTVYSQIVTDNIIKPDLAAGNYTIVILNKGNATVISSNATRNFKVLKLTPTLNINVYNTTFPDDIIVEVTSDCNGQYYVTVGGETIKMNLTLGIAQNFTFNLSAGKYNVIVGCSESQNYTDIMIDSYKAEIFKFTPTISVESSDVAYMNDVIISIKSDVNGSYTLKFGENTQIITLTENITQNITFTKPDADYYLINVTYGETQNYNFAKNDSVTVWVFKKIAPISAKADVNKTNVQITVNVDENMTGFVSMDLYDSPIYIPITDGTAQLSLTLKSGNYKLNIKYPSNDEYYENSTVLMFTVPEEIKKTTPISLDVKTDENAALITVSVNENATGVVKFTLISKENNESSTLYRDLENGSVIQLVDDLDPGKYRITVTYMGDSTYDANTTSQDFEVIGHIMKDTEIYADAEINADKVTLTVKVNKNATGFVEVKYDDTIFNIALENGEGRYTTTLPYGSYNFDITYLGDENYNVNSTKLEFTVAEPTKENTPISLDVNIDENTAVITATVSTDATGIVQFKVMGQEEYSLYTDVVNGRALLEDILESGNYTVVATYLGDDRFNTNITSKDFTLIGHVKKDTPIKADVSVNANRVKLTVSVADDATGFVKLDIDGTIVNLELTDGVATLTTTLPANSYFVEINYLGDENYNANATKLAFTVVDTLKKDTPISIDIETLENNVTFKVNVNQDATGIIMFYVTGPEEYTLYADVVNGEAVLDDVLKTGKYSLTAKYMGDSLFNTNITFKDFTVTGHEMKDTPISADVETNGNKVTLTVNVDENATGFAAVKYSDTVVNIALTDGEGTYTTTLPYGSYNLDITYLGDENYNANSTKLDFTLKEPKKENTSISLDVSVDENSVIVTASVNKDATGIVKFQITGPEDYVVYYDVVNGKAVLENLLKAGVYTVVATYMGNDKYNNASTITGIIINPKQNATVDISADEVTEGENVTVSATLPEDATGNLTAVVNGKTYTTSVENGTATITIPDLAKGSYTILVTYSGDDKYNPVNKEVKVAVNEDTSDIISAPDIIKHYNGSERFVVSLSDSEGNPLVNKSVSITINGVTYSRTTDEDGNASIGLGLPAGVYNVTVVALNQTVNSIVTIISTINGTDLIKVFRNATQYYATFLDSEGNYLAEGTEVNFNINGVMYTRKVGENGMARLNINLEQGKYIITAINPTTGEMSSNNITVIPRIVENNDLTKYYRNASQYTVKILGDEGNAVGAGVEVTFNINGVFYTRTTNESGIAKLNINLEVGDYIITASYGGCNVSNNITVLPILNATDLTKKYGTPDQFVATLVDGHGNPYARQSVTFNINGVFYNRLTDSSGNAKLNINLMSGEYIITSSYNGSNIANKITIS